MSIEIPKYVTPQNIQPHPRILLRAWIKQLLIVNTDLGGNWRISKPNPIWLEEVPLGLIYFTDEPATGMNTAPKIYKKTIALTIEVVNRVNPQDWESIDEWLDSRAYEIELAMISDKFLGHRTLVEDCRLVRTVPSQVEVENADSNYHALKMFFEIDYKTSHSMNVHIDEFLSYIHEIEGTNNENISQEVTIRED